MRAVISLTLLLYTASGCQSRGIECLKLSIFTGARASNVKSKCFGYVLRPYIHDTRIARRLLLILSKIEHSASTLK